MTRLPNESLPPRTSSIDEAIVKAKARADAMLADFMAQDPLTIDIADRVPHLPRGVLDVLVEMKDQLNQRSRTAIDEWQERERQRGRELWELVERQHDQFVASLPPNWQSPEVEFPDLSELESLQLKEGLPLAWVPPNDVLRRVLGANTAAGRRRIIAAEADAILTACMKELRRLKSGETTQWRGTAIEAARVMKAGYWRAGQALAAIALDTATEKFVRASFSEATKHFSNGKPNPPGSSPRTFPTWYEVDYPRALLVLHSLYGAFSMFRGKSGEPVPAQFTRHGTVHSMSGRQYSKANALISLMHLVGLLCLIEDG
ncbi:hypothetical protein QN345_12695 [Cryobacterium sp. 10I1]|uniref:hypothetical protein n=1 Tax=unclassified Cryobacterium TaxID=2649013 RepID=UPI002B22A478|nr:MULTISPECIES: hypothetical protein [unclassified Cryobacterium]MEB0200373.1 hypothetical protein [Cryobacterium sp. 5I3]MEB0306161.1 hypothetical protein [Cryobacterium sp. 10I1]